ncbi:hypothetical protein [Gloeobacter kilaueensis]|uniref:hypothetical protein n=1 Tax=Gloeobacter kilaueensis TaxID=1416614 RepID=UPI0004157AA7|nr:hypothetical protein [Gloeobacter kilaueensis]
MLLLLLLFWSAPARLVRAYQWGSVAIGGGGYITGIYLHPKAAGLAYLRTDIGGFYRWNGSSHWIALTDGFTADQSNYYGGEALALDPADPNLVYIACGKDLSVPGALFKSTDQGAHWSPLGLNVPMGGNADRRWAGERLAVDPFDSRLLLFGSRRNGLLRSSDGGMSWSAVSIPAVHLSDGIGVLSLAFDSRTRGLVYLNAYGDGIYLSQDSGLHWSRIPGSPDGALRLAVSGDGSLYVSHSQGVARYAAGQWSDLSPEANTSFDALDVSPLDPRQILVATDQSSDTHIYYSKNGGTSWTLLSRSLASTLPWFDPAAFTRSTAAVAFDPFVAGKAWLSDWYAVYQTADFTAQPTIWRNAVGGIEQTVTFGLSAPASGPLLVSAIADLDGFVHDRGLDAAPSQTFGGRSGPWYQDTYSLDSDPAAPLQLVRVGGNRWQNPYQGGVAVSGDGGRTWRSSGSFPAGTIPLRVAMATGNPSRFVVVTSNGLPLFTSNGGQTWQPVSGLPLGPTGPWYWGQPLAADRVEANTFYYYSGGTVYRSDDGGERFASLTSTLPAQDGALLKTAPGRQGEVWLSLDGEGLYHSIDAAHSFQPIASVQQAHLFALGKPAPGSTVPALYLYGSVVGLGSGIFQSLDAGQSWTSIGNFALPIGDAPNTMEASWQRFGLVFVGTNGRGIYYGMPAAGN